MIRVFDAFSGIGGFRSAFERVVGFKTVGWCEIDRFAQKSYRALFDTGGEQFYEKIRDIDTAELEMMQSKLYEELLLGQLPRETLIVMSQKYKIEKTVLEQKSLELQSELDRLTAKAEDIRSWLCVVCEYMSGTVFDRELLHRLIKVIRVEETKVVDGQKQREVEIIYRF